MTSEKGAETPMEKYVKFKNNIHLWYQEMKQYGLTNPEIEILKPYFESSYGVPPSQEQLMRMLMDDQICGFSLAQANDARKVVGKKQMSKIPALRQQIFDTAKSQNLAKYVWDNGVGTQVGYSFSCIHALAYSFIGYQNAFLATKWNSIYWNTACLIVDSGSLEDNEVIEEDLIHAEQKEKGTDYVKTAKALNKFINRGIKISLIDINKSELGFKPDVENNQILFGLKALSGVNTEVIEKIIANRPYNSFAEFMFKCPLNKLAMISLIKSGAFDSLEQEWETRTGIPTRYLVMSYYLYKTSDLKTKLNLQNFNGLLQAGLIPEQFNLEKRFYNFNKALKTNCKWREYYVLNGVFLEFYNKFCNADYLTVINGVSCIEQKKWDKIYTTKMDTVRQWLKDNQIEVLKKYNHLIWQNSWSKYASDNISAWEMSSLCFYYHEHELINVDPIKYGLSDFNELPENPVVDYYFPCGNRQIPIYKLTRIIGTVIAKDKIHHSIVLLTTTGVVTVKFTKEYFAQYACRISEVQADGSKKVMEEGWFKRGVKVLCTGFRREDTFVAKSYKNTPTHQLYMIEEVKNGNLKLRHERYQSSTSSSEEG